jgi:hypothetical protein
MGQERRRTCASCGEIFTPDPRNARHQRYCGRPACRAASKLVSQAKWLAKPENRNYHRGAAAVARVQAWGQAHPGYKPAQEWGAAVRPGNAPRLGWRAGNRRSRIQRKTVIAVTPKCSAASRKLTSPRSPRSPSR